MVVGRRRPYQHSVNVKMSQEKNYCQRTPVDLMFHGVPLPLPVSLLAMRWYPQGIQKLVSTYELHPNLGVLQTNSSPKCQDLPIFSFGIWGGGVLQTNSSPKCQDLPKFSFFWGEGAVLQTNIPEILEWGHSRNFEPKILPTGMCSASQIVSHILCMWRLTSSKLKVFSQYCGIQHSRCCHMGLFLFQLL